MTEPKCGLALIDTNAEQLKLENCLQIAVTGWIGALDPKSRLTNAKENGTARSELIPESRQFSGAHNVEPIWVDLSKVVAGVQHRESVKLNSSLRSRFDRVLRRFLYLFRLWLLRAGVRCC